MCIFQQTEATQICHFYVSLYFVLEPITAKMLLLHQKSIAQDLGRDIDLKPIHILLHYGE